MTHSFIPAGILYAGLAGVVLALIIATAQNRWSLRVFFLLALRLAIGWHFLFEGLYKVNSHMVGPVQGPDEKIVKPFSSEGYVRAATGPLGPLMRRQFEDPVAIIDSRVRAPKKDIRPEEFAALTADQQAAECPKAVADELDKMEAAAEQTAKADAEKQVTAVKAAEDKDIAAIDAAEKKELEAAKTDDEKAKIKAKFAADRKSVQEEAKTAWEAARKKVEGFKEAGKALVVAAKASYARWVYSVDARPAKVKFVTGDVALTAPQRLELLDWLRRELKAAEERQSPGLGNGTGTDAKRVAAIRMELLTAESDLAGDSNSFVAELQKNLNGGKAPEEAARQSRGQFLDKVTMWFLVGVGACLMAGLLTRLACVLAAGFLVTTYLLHPPFPWYPLPPNTEGNPVFINKNVLECLALLVLACYPTGRWLGLDALVLRPFCRHCCGEKTETPPVPPSSPTA